MDKEFWNRKYIDKINGWDIGYVSPPIKEYIDQLKDRNIKILIPGAGSGYEAEYAFRSGFKNIFILDWAKEAISEFRKRVPEFPAGNILIEDFFGHKGKYDLVIEQTFFCSLLPEMRKQYAEKIYDLLNDKGKLAGLLFNREFDFEGPPFGGSKEEYEIYFKGLFEFKTFENAYNSIQPRAGKELFIIFGKK